MGVRKTNTSSFRRVRSGFAVSRHVVRKTSSQIAPLVTKEEEQKQSGGSVDPSRFMTRKQKKAWRRLSPAKGDSICGGQRRRSCEDGRQWFIRRNEYQERGSYEPAPGDIVYFRHGNETVSHHVGIVEYG